MLCVTHYMQYAERTPMGYHAERGNQFTFSFPLCSLYPLWLQSFKLFPYSPHIPQVYLVPMLCVGMRTQALCVTHYRQYAERTPMGYHAERGNQFTFSFPLWPQYFKLSPYSPHIP